MSFLRSSTGLVRPMVSRGGVGLLRAPGNIAAPAIVQPPSGQGFDMVSAESGVRGWYGSNNQFANIEAPRDWDANFSDQNESFSAVRWQQTWLACDGFYGQWEPAGGDVFRLYRKGDSGQDARTVVLVCGPNPAAVPAGGQVVLWLSPGPGSYEGTALNLAGYNLPLRQKLTCTASTGSAWWDTEGRRIIELDAGQALPYFDYEPPLREWSGGMSTVQHRHWSFFKDGNNLRHPLGNYVDISRNSILANGGRVVLGGCQMQPVWVDRSREYRLIGASLVEELWRDEMRGLAEYLGDTDPRLLAIELENEPTSEWHDVGEGPGYGDLLPDVWHGIARQEWGPSRTLIVKGSGFGGLNTLLDEFDFRSPDNQTHLCIHNYDDQIRYPDGSIIRWTDIGQTDWVADQLKSKINELGYSGGGTTEIGVDAGRASGDADRGQRLGRILSSFTSRDMYAFAWSMVGDNVRCSDVQTIGGRRIEAFHRGLAPYCRRANIMTV